MRRLSRLLLLLAAVWCLWWFSASAILRTSVESWFDARRNEGWQADARDIAGGGFPLWLQANLQDVQLADPETGVAVRTDRLDIEADAWWPGQARVRLPDTPVEFAAPDGRAELTMSDGVMRMDLAPSTGLTLKQLAWTSEAWGIVGPEGSIFSADSLRLAMVQQGDAEIYHFDINMDAARPGRIPRTRLQIPDDWPVALDALQLDMQVTFDRSWDLRALEDRRPQPRHIDLRLAEAAWADLRLNLAADLAIDADGVPSGTINLQAQNWQAMLTLAENAGTLRSDLRPQAQRLLGLLASASGNPETIDVTLTARGGLLMLGLLPIGPAPRFTLR